MTSSHMIFETKLPITSWITSICPSCDGHRILMGSGDGTVRMWNVNLARNQAITMDTQDDESYRSLTLRKDGGHPIRTIY